MVSPSHSPHWIVTGEKEAKRRRRTPWIGNVIGFQPGHDHIKMLTYTLIQAGRPMHTNTWIHFSVDSEAYIRRTRHSFKSIAWGWYFDKITEGLDLEVAYGHNWATAAQIYTRCVCPWRVKWAWHYLMALLWRYISCFPVTYLNVSIKFLPVIAACSYNADF